MHKVNLRVHKDSCSKHEFFFSKFKRFYLWSRWFILGGILIQNGLACYFPEVVLNEDQKKEVERHLLSSRPTPQYSINAIIEDQIRLIGFDLSTNKVQSGKTFTITYYLEGLSPNPKDSKMFVHLQGRGKGAWQNLDHVPIKGYYPIRLIKKGQIVKDVQHVRVKPAFKPGTAKLYWGLYQGRSRLKLKNSKDVKHDKRNRVYLGTLQIQRGTALPTAFAQQKVSPTPILIDGVLSEPVWKRSRWTHHWSDPQGNSKKRKPKTRAKFAWDSDHVYVGVECWDSDIWATLEGRDQKLWEQEVVELFIDHDGDYRDYLELQVSPANQVFDARFDYRRSSLKKAMSWNFKGWETAVHLEGTLNQRTDQDVKYVVEMKIPVQEIIGKQRDIKQKLKADDTWKINLFRFDRPKDKRTIALAFSPPIIPDFHALDAFGTLKFLPASPQLRSKDSSSSHLSNRSIHSQSNVPPTPNPPSSSTSKSVSTPSLTPKPSPLP